VEKGSGDCLWQGLQAERGLALVSNKASEEYFRLVRWLFVYSPASKIRLRGKTYEDARQLLNLKTRGIGGG